MTVRARSADREASRDGRPSSSSACSPPSSDRNLTSPIPYTNDVVPFLVKYNQLSVPLRTFIGERATVCRRAV
eukprot:scaffold130509_cov33-Prasinocladus_malaysianus.AAC.1